MRALRMILVAIGFTLAAASLALPPRCDETAPARPPASDRRASRSREARAPKPLTPGEQFVGAARSGDLDTVKAMLAGDTALISSKDEFEYTALHYAPSKDMAEFLIATGADVNAAGYLGWTPVVHAASTGHTEVIAALVARKVDVNVKDMHGRTPLDIAVEYEHADTSAFLKEHGGTATRVAKAPEPPPASDAALNALVKDAVQSGLSLAAMKGNEKGVKDMIAQGADVNLPESGGGTVLCDAVQFEQVGVVKLLLGVGANPNLSCGGATPLSRAFGNDEITALLKAAGAK